MVAVPPFAALSVVSRVYSRRTLNKRLRPPSSACAAGCAGGSQNAAGRVRTDRHCPAAGSFTTDANSLGVAVRNFVHLFSGAAFLLSAWPI